MDIYKFEPIYKERVWGGLAFKDFLKRPISSGEKIGESWDLVDRPNDQSLVLQGIEKGQSLRELVQGKPSSFMGPGWNPTDPFPILVKWLDCNARLSLQVHPPQNVARQLGGEPKTENWYVANTTGDAALFVGLKKETTKNDFEAALRNNQVEQYCHRVDSEAGDSMLVQSGRIHAIDAGNLILEIQQNSDTTYRVYDWGRLGLDNKPRQLHVEESMQCIDFMDFEPMPLKSKDKMILANAKEFRIKRVNLLTDSNLLLKSKNSQCAIISVVQGKVEICDQHFSIGEHAVSPYNADCLINCIEPATLLVTDNFFLPNNN